MLFDVQNDVEIARRASECAGLPVAAKTDASAVFHARRHFGFHGAPPASCAKQVAYPEELAKDVAEVLKSIGIESSHASRPGNPSMPKAVIRRALISVDQNGIRFGKLFEFVFCLRIIRIPVRMVLH